MRSRVRKATHSLIWKSRKDLQRPPEYLAMNLSPSSEPPAQRSVCVFCASSNGAEPIFLEAAKALGRSIAERGWQLVYGGADVGLMGALADAALSDGARSPA